jgi:hypothetical protein
VKQKFAKLIDVKSIVTLLMTIAMILMLTGLFTPSSEAFGLFATTYGAVITYFFTKKKDNAEGE